MTNVEKYTMLRDKFLDIIVDHYKSLGGVEKDESMINEIRGNMQNDIDSIIDEVGIEEAISYVENLIDDKDEFLEMSEKIHAGTYNFLELIDNSITEVLGIKIGDVLLREDEKITVLCKVIGFTELESPIVEYLNVEYHVDISKEGALLLYKAGDVMPYPYEDFYKDKFI